MAEPVTAGGALAGMRRGRRPCRIVVLGGTAAPEAHAATMADLKADLYAGQRIDAFNGHALPALDDLVAALQHLQPDAHSDVAWVRAGTRLPPGWWATLQAALDHDPLVAAMCPLSLDDPWFSPLPAGCAVGEGDAQRAAAARALTGWLAAHAPAQPLELGALLTDAGVMRGDAAVALALATRIGEPMVIERWTRQGWVTAMSRQVVVTRIPSDTTLGAADGPGQGGTIPPSGLLADRELWHHAHPLTGLRYAVKEAWPQPVEFTPPQPAAMTAPTAAHPNTPTTEPAPGAPRVRLHVAHSWGGGLSKWVRDFVRTDRQVGGGTGLVLRSVGIIGGFGQRLSLYAGEEEVIPLRFWELGVPIHATATAHLEVRAILAEIIDTFGVEQVIVSSLIGHSLDVLRTGLPTVIVAHDHHPFCVALYAHFDGECRRCDAPQLQRCLDHNPGHRFFQGVRAQDWLALRAAFTSVVAGAHLPIVAPSPSVAQRWQSMMPELSPGQFRVIPHGLDLPRPPDFEPPHDGPLRVVMLGRLTQEKGSDILAAMLPALLEFAELILVGCGDRDEAALRHPRVTVVPHFHNPDLPAVLSQARPHVGLLMSTVPETFSYALSELWHAGIPVLGTDSGALADRIEPGLSGELAPAQPAALLDALRRLDGQRDALARMRRGLLAREGRTLEAMVRDVLALLPPAPQRAADASAQRELLAAADSAASTHPERPSHAQALQVNPEATWGQAARAFWQFTCLKASRSPKLAPWVRAWFRRRLRT